MIPNIRETTPWRPWGNSDLDLAGWVTYYDKLTFVVVRGAGHVITYYYYSDGTIRSKIKWF